MPRPISLIALMLGLPLSVTGCVELDVTSQKDPALTKRIAELEAQRRANPADLNVVLELGMTMQANGELFAAAEVLKQAAEQNPNAPEPLLGLHRVYTDLGYGLPAFKALEQCVEKNPRQAECVYRLASFLLLQDGSEAGMKRSRELFVRFLDIAPDHPQAAIVRDAIARMEESLGPMEPGSVPSSQPSSRPAEPGPADKLGAHDGAEGQEVGALNPFGQAIAEAMRAADRQDAPAAEAAFRRALEFQPGDGIATAGLAEALFTQGKIDDAVQNIEKAYASDPAEPIVQFVFGVVMVKSRRDVARGLEAWQKLSKAQPDYAQKLGVPQMIQEASRAPGK